MKAFLRAIPVEMSLRDQLAVMVGPNEVERISYNCLSRDAKEMLLGRQYPDDPGGENRGKRVAYQLEAAKFECMVSAKLRYMLADALLTVRNKSSGLHDEDDGVYWHADQS